MRLRAVSGVLAAVVVGAVLFFARGPASSQARNISVEAMRTEKRVALVIGNAGYAAPADLKNPINDARDMAAALRGLGFDVILQTDADLKALQRAARDFSVTSVSGVITIAPGSAICSIRAARCVVCPTAV